MGKRFSRLPNWWVREEEVFKEFEGGATSGVSIAALKCAMAISLKIDFTTRQVQMSFSELQKMTGLSRPMVSRGIAILESLGIVNIFKNSYINTYRMTITKDDDRWAKLPTDLLTSRLCELPNRGAIGVAALKLYLLLVSFRPNISQDISMTHENMRNYTGIQKKHVRPALDILFSHSLIRITSAASSGGEHSYNVYTIMGISV